VNLLHVIPYYAPAWTYGGSVRAAADLTCALVADGHSVYVLTTDTLSPVRRTPRRRETIGGVHVYRMRNLSNTLRGRLNLSTPTGIANVARHLIQDHAIDVVHCHELRTVENLRVAPVANALGVPVVVSPHGTLPYGTGRPIMKRLWDRVLGRRLLPRFDRVVALTANEAAEAKAVWTGCHLTLPDDRVSIVPNGVHPQEFASLPPRELFRTQWKLGDGPVVLFLGRLHERKGLHLLIPAFAEAVKAAPDARLVIAGPDEGMLATLKDQVNQFTLGGRVVFTGMLAGDEKLAALASADLFALPAVGEGFSMAVLEAMACGRPVLLTPGCNFPEVADAGAGVIVPREVGALNEALRTLLIDGERRVSMGQLARKLVEERFTWPQVVAQMVEVYRHVSSQKGCQPDSRNRWKPEGVSTWEP
jgi:glycosyltransferase involved in cell wall biosynthesis